MKNNSAQRVLFWSESFWPYRGGAELFGLRLIETLQPHGYEFTVVTSHHSLELPDHDNYQGIVIHRLPFRQALRDKRIEDLVAACRRVEKLKEALQPDIIHLNGLSASGWFHLRSAPAYAAPTLVRMNSQILPEASAAENSLSFNLLRAADRICCVSSRIAEEAVAGLPEIRDRISVIPNGILLPALISPLPIQPPRLLCLGRLAREKGFDLAMTALRKVVDRCPEVSMIVAGDGPERAILARQVTDLSLDRAVAFVGWIEPREIPALINQTTLVLMPSRREGLPNVAIEAGSFGRPVIATRVGGLPEIVQNGETGLIVDPEDAEGLARGILQLLDHPDLAKQMGIAARRRVEEQFNWHECELAYEALYKTLVAARTNHTADHSYSEVRN